MKPLAVAAYKAEHIFFYDIIFDKRIKTAVLINLVKIEIARAYYSTVVAFNLFTVATHIFSVIGAFAADVITAASQKNLAAVFQICYYIPHIFGKFIRIAATLKIAHTQKVMRSNQKF